MYLLMAILSFLLGFNEVDFKSEVEKYLNENLSQYEKIEFEISSLPELSENENIAIDKERDLRLTGKMLYLPIKIFNDENIETQSLISLKVKLYKKVYVANFNIERNTELKNDQFTEKIVDIADLRSTPLLMNIENYKSKVSINTGEILTEKYVEEIPVIKRGDKVTAILQKGSVTISFDAIARQDGIIGENIRVVSTTKKLFRAKVIDQSSVSIIE